MDIMTFALICGAVGVVYGLITTAWVLKQDPGSPRMQEISAAVREGANAFLNREYKTVAMVGAVVFVLLFGWASTPPSALSSAPPARVCADTLACT